MPSFEEVIYNRQSIRKYSQQPVEQDKLDRIIDAAIAAPTAANKQPWILCVLKNPRKHLDAIIRQKWALDAPIVVIIFGEKEASWTRSWDSLSFHMIDATIVMDHLILAATNEGLATCWIAANDPEAIRKACNIGSNYTFLALTPIGYAAETPPKKDRKSKEELIREL
ncbi:MAG: nitroreductase family protein [Candidatus Hodarchaeota archaeon]